MVLVVAMLAAIGAWEIYKGTVLKAQSYLQGPVDHFVCYKIEERDEDSKFKAVVKIQNQLEYSTVKVDDDDRVLCVPTAKELVSLTVEDEDDD